MIKIVITALFFICLGILAAVNSHVEVTVRLNPLGEPTTLSFSSLMMLFTVSGVLFAMVVALIDRAQLQARHRKTRKELEKIKGENQSLRELATLEKDGD